MKSVLTVVIIAGLFSALIGGTTSGVPDLSGDAPGFINIAADADGDAAEEKPEEWPELPDRIWSAAMLA